MNIFELVIPGTHLNFKDKMLALKFKNLLEQLESAFYDANVALNLFDSQRAKEFYHDDSTPERWHINSKKKQELKQKICKERGLSLYDYDVELDAEVEIILKKEKWESGEHPLSHLHRVIFLHAKSFIYALDAIEKFLKVISEEQDSPHKIKLLHAQIDSDFPNLRGVRNSAHHPEDRARGLGAGKPPQPLKLQTVDSDFFSAPQEALMLGSLCETKFGCTMADGHYGEVDISKESMVKLQFIIQEAFNAFEWIGPKQHLPK
ncbi:hypothetical protein HPB55_29905 [Klebsiella michiganensis]|nr:hypothetical protein [Klebsiella michiganensis]MBQ4664366.1 hypothetical protein [Klebsiella michiganensis]MBZ7134083.1 hypothetical protein [Klebsiella michiganensis]RFC02032.1 hypothetical protein DDJ70_30765 [Klebsiella michiganensis]TCZ62817.1 hypothetical protein E0D83_01265 [Klebsiella grimontii]